MKNTNCSSARRPIPHRFLVCVLLMSLLFAALPTVSYADVSRDASLYVGETLTVTHYSNYSKDFTYQWAVVSGADCIRVLSDLQHVDCRVEAVKAGRAVLCGTATRGRNHQYKHTVTIEVTEPSFTITFDANGGRVKERTMQITDGGNVGILPKPSWAGHSFAGWFTDPAAGEQIRDNITVHITGDVTLYAHWTADAATPSISTGSGSITTRVNGTSGGGTSGSSESPYSSGESFCSFCGGLGDCPECFGECCVDCPNLCLMGNCPHCDGFGSTVSYSGGQMKERECVYCKGSGDCSRCKGAGVIECPTCHGKGDCPVCHGKLN